MQKHLYLLDTRDGRLLQPCLQIIDWMFEVSHGISFTIKRACGNYDQILDVTFYSKRHINDKYNYRLMTDIFHLYPDLSVRNNIYKYNNDEYIVVDTYNKLRELLRFEHRYLTGVLITLNAGCYISDITILFNGMLSINAHVRICDIYYN